MPYRIVVILLILLGAAVVPAAEIAPTGSFVFEFTVQLPGTPDEVFAAATGDIFGWWDHTMSGDPLKLYIEPRPGGAFMEIFDESGDGVRHAVVTGAQRGKMLRMEGPLGLAGHALHMVTTWTLAEAEGGGTDFTVQVHGAGEVHEGWGDIVQKTWVHFIEGRLKPYLEDR